MASSGTFPESTRIFPSATLVASCCWKACVYSSSVIIPMLRRNWARYSRGALLAILDLLANSGTPMSMVQSTPEQAREGFAAMADGDARTVSGTLSGRNQVAKLIEKTEDGTVVASAEAALEDERARAAGAPSVRAPAASA